MSYAKVSNNFISQLPVASCQLFLTPNIANNWATRSAATKAFHVDFPCYMPLSIDTKYTDGHFSSM
jgi:hypothetical protein